MTTFNRAVAARWGASLGFRVLFAIAFVLVFFTGVALATFLLPEWAHLPTFLIWVFTVAWGASWLTVPPVDLAEEAQWPPH